MRITYQEAVAIINREALVNSLVSKYMNILSIKGKKPIVVIKNRLTSGWVGRCQWAGGNADTTTILLLSSILVDPHTLERIIAHEMIHHRNFIDPNRESGHGADFIEGAAIVNAVMGPNFVTEFSDKSYVQSKNTKYFYMVIVPVLPDPTPNIQHFEQLAPPPPKSLGFAWIGTLTPSSKPFISVALAAGGKLFKTTEERWLHGRKLDRQGLFTVPKADSEEQKLLGEMYSGKSPMGTFQIRKL
jgi:hypothetical protein